MEERASYLLESFFSEVMLRSYSRHFKPVLQLANPIQKKLSSFPLPSISAWSSLATARSENNTYEITLLWISQKPRGQVKETFNHRYVDWPWFMLMKCANTPDILKEFIWMMIEFNELDVIVSDAIWLRKFSMCVASTIDLGSLYYVVCVGGVAWEISVNQRWYFIDVESDDDCKCCDCYCEFAPKLKRTKKWLEVTFVAYIIETIICGSIINYTTSPKNSPR